MTKKSVAILLALVLVLSCAVGSTIAWLTDSTGEVKNTFSPSDINITLEESEDLDLQMIPGHAIAKDPKAAVLSGSEECYLFVKIEKSANFDTYMTYAVAEGWTELEDGVYYIKIDSAEKMDVAYSILAGDQVTVKGDVTKELMNALTAETYPTLTFTAYASQLYKSAGVEFTPAEAWTNINA